MKYEGISTQLYKELEKASREQLRNVSVALIDAAKEMVVRARTNFVGNNKGYQVQSLADGILLGKYRKNNDGTRSITIHGMGDRNKSKTWKARLFITGGYHRQTKRGHYRGTIEGIDVIANALDQNILDKHIKKALQ